MNSWIVIGVWIIVLVINVVYGFLPAKTQQITWVRATAILIAVSILFVGLNKEVNTYINRIEARVANDGSILSSKNFPWDIRKIANTDGTVSYIVSDRYGDASQVVVKSSNKKVKPVVKNSLDGIVINFDVPKQKIDEFEIRIKN